MIPEICNICYRWTFYQLSSSRKIISAVRHFVRGVRKLKELRAESYGVIRDCGMFRSYMTDTASRAVPQGLTSTTYFWMIASTMWGNGWLNTGNLPSLWLGEGEGEELCVFRWGRLDPESAETVIIIWFAWWVQTFPTEDIIIEAVAT